MSTLIVTNVKNTSSATNNIVTNTDGSATIAGASITLGTSVASTSGTSIDFTSIPSWVKRVMVMFNGVSTNGTSIVLIQLGTSSGFVATGYLGSASYINTASVTSVSTFTTGFAPSYHSSASDVRHGHVVIATTASNAWTMTSVVNLSNVASNGVGAGSITLSGTLDRVRITTVGGTNTFDAGSINIAYE